MAAGEQALLAAAASLMDSARSLEHFAEKMESISEQQASVLDRLSDKLDNIGKGGKGSGGKSEDTALGGIANKFKSLTSSLSDLADAGPKLKEGFSALTNGLKELNISLKIFSQIPQESVDNLIKFLKNISDKFEDINTKKIKEGGEGISAMASGIAMFGIVLLLSTPVYAVAAVGSLVIIPLIAGYAYLFSQLGEKEIVERVDAGSGALLHMGLGLVSFALGLFAVKQLSGGDWGEFAKGSLIVAAGAAVFSGLFYLLGGKEYSERVENGSKALVFTGVALASLALGIWSFQALNVDAGSVLIAGLSVLVVGAAFGIIGSFEKNIEKGAEGLFFSGVALASLALGIWSFQALDIQAGTVMVAGLAVGVLGVLFGIAGKFAGEIALGALAFLGVSLAVIALGYGFEMFRKNDVTLEDIGIVSGSLTALGLVMAGAGAISWLIIPGAAALLLSGAALVSIGKGLKAFDEVDFDTEDADKMSYVISSLAASFSLAGGKEGMSSFLGISVGKNAVERGISSVLDAGEALTSIASGLVAFRNLKLGPNDAMDLWGTPENPGSIAMTVGGISAAFGEIGGKNRGAKGVLGWLGVERNAVEEGINSVLKVSKALMDIAKGITEFRKLKLGKNEASDLFGENGSIRTVLEGINIAFSAIGGKNREASGFLGWLGVERNDVEEGIGAVQGVGKTLVDLAEGVKGFANLTFTDPITGKQVKLDESMIGPNGTVLRNIVSVVNAVSGVFGMIGAKQKPAGGIMGFFGATDNAVADGIKAVKGIGGELVALAKGVADFAALKFTDAKGNVVLITPEMFGDEKNPGTIRKNIMQVVTAVSSVFGMIGSSGEVSAGGFSGLFGAKENVVAKGIEAVKGIGTELTKIASSVQVFSQIKDLDKIKSNIMSIVTSVPAAFLVAYQKYIKLLPDEAMSKIKSFNNILSDFIDALKEVPDNANKKSSDMADSFTKMAMGLNGFANLKDASIEKTISYLERMANTVDPLTKLADSFSKIATSMDKFAMSFKKMNPQTVKTSDMLIQSLVTFSKVDPNSLNTLTDKGKALINFIYEKNETTKKADAPVTQPTPSPVVHNEPGKKQVAPAVNTKENEAAAKMNQQLVQMMNDMTDNMGRMAGALRDIKMILQGTIKVQTIS